MGMENYAPLIAVAIAPIAYYLIRALLIRANAALKAVWPDGKLKGHLFKER